MIASHLQAWRCYQVSEAVPSMKFAQFVKGLGIQLPRACISVLPLEAG